MSAIFLTSRELFGKSGSLPGSGPDLSELRPACAVSGVNFRRTAIRSQLIGSLSMAGEQTGFAYAECVRGDRAAGFIYAPMMQRTASCWIGNNRSWYVPDETQPLAGMEVRALLGAHLSTSGVTFTHCR